jgi:hypothetical protein
VADTYFNAGGRFWIQVPVEGLGRDLAHRKATLQLVIGGKEGAEAGMGRALVPAYTEWHNHWLFNEFVDDL